MEHGAMLEHGSRHTKGHDFPFDLGDAVAIYYQNLPENVEAALQGISRSLLLLNNWFLLDKDSVEIRHIRQGFDIVDKDSSNM